MNLIPRPFFWLVNLVKLHKCVRKMAHRWEVRVLIDDGRIERHPRMLIKPPADHLPIFRPLVIGVERGVNPDESLSVFLDERHHVFLLAVIEIKLSCSTQKNDSVEVVEVLGVSAEIFLRNEFD